jgi:cell division protease FtsH
MVCQWGMSESIGPLALDNREGQEVFMGRDFVQGKNFSEKIAAEIDKEIHRIVTTGYKRAFDLLKDDQKTLENLAEALLIKETLLGPDMKRIIAGDRLDKATKAKDVGLTVEA